jgi:hypothetical protein
MDYAFQGRHPPHQLHALVAQNTHALEEHEWDADSAANAHIANDLDNLRLQQPFQGTDSIGVGSVLPLFTLLIPSFLSKMSYTVLRQQPTSFPSNVSVLIMIVFFS